MNSKDEATDALHSGPNHPEILALITTQGPAYIKFAQTKKVRANMM